MSDSPVDPGEDGEPNARERRDKSFYVIRDNFQTLHDVLEAIQAAGVNDCELIFGIDYTINNKSQGTKTFGGLSLHDTGGPSKNPYQQVICILGKTLEALDKDGWIPAYCFGDTLFPLKSEGPCKGFNEVLDIYNEVTKEKELSGTTNFVPVIEEAVKIVKETKKYHILVIVTDGKIDKEKLKPTQDAIVEASKWPLSIVVIGVGDGPWETMKTFNDGLPECQFDNFQFVDFHETVAGARNAHEAVALRAIMEIPNQYKLIKDHELLIGLGPSKGSTEVLDIYNEVTKDKELSGTPDFVPVIDEAVQIVQETIKSDSEADQEEDGELNARKRREKQFYVIRDNYQTLHDVTKAIADAGVDDCELIFGIDYTISNKSQGTKTFGGLSLHDTSGPSKNPYQQVICILGETLETLDKDGWIPAYCFGDTLFPLKSEGPCKGFNEVLDIYNKAAKDKELTGTPDFVPVIEEAVKIVKETKKYHILVIVTNGKIEKEKLKPTQDAIVEASKWPLSIVVIGVGDGPWETMKTFDDELSERQFDNFQFVDFHETVTGARNAYAAVALRALMEIPDQYKLVKDHELLKKSDSLPDEEDDGELNAWRRREKRFYVIRDNYQTLHDITKAMADAGVDDCELIFGIDYTISNKTQGTKTFGGLSLHDTSGANMNPYQQVICILGETLETLDKDGWIPAFCFGDTLFPLKSEGPCKGFNEVLDIYNEVTKEKELSGTPDFVPVIEEAVKIVKETKKYHILVIVTNGKIEKEKLKPTQDAIVEASKWPLSIVVIGVGDGPWETMKTFDDGLLERQFDNFQFVDFHETVTGAKNAYAAVALRALMEIPDQYKLIKDHELLIGLKQPDSSIDQAEDGELNARKWREKQFYVIRENYQTLHDVTKAMADAGVDDCELIFGIDYTISNKSQGQKTFGGLSLHDTSGPNFNPYQQVIHILGETLETLAKDGWIPAFCFGDTLFPLKSEGLCKGFNEVLDIYNQVTKQNEPSGTSDLVPVIEKAVQIVKDAQKYHILVIITDGKIVNMEPTHDAIVEASKWPLSIVVIGVGDGPWEAMKKLDDELPEREFDNFQFVDFHKTITGANNTYGALALGALMKIPEQYNLIKHHDLLRKN